MSERAQLAKVIKRRYLYALAISEVIGTFIAAPVVGTAMQYSFGTAYHGIAGTIIGDYFPGVTLFIVLWIGLNRAFYRRPPTWRGRTREVMTELRPFLVIGVIAAVPAYVLTAGISVAYVLAAEQLSTSFPHVFPVIVVSETLNYTIEEVMFIYIDLKLIGKPLGAFVDRYADAMGLTGPAVAVDLADDSDLGSDG